MDHDDHGDDHAPTASAMTARPTSCSVGTATIRASMDVLYVPVLGHVPADRRPHSLRKPGIALPALGGVGGLACFSPIPPALIHPSILWVPLRRLDPAGMQVGYDSRSQVPWGGPKRVLVRVACQWFPSCK